MYKCRRMFKSLYQIRFDRILQERRHSAGCLQIIRRYRFPVKIICYNNPAQTLLQIRKILRQTENCHDFGCHRNYKMIFSYHSVHFVSKTYYDVAEHPVIHIQTSFPHNLPRINSEGISLLNVVIQHCSQQIIGRCNRMKISCKMKVQFIHGNYLSISASGCSSFYSEAGTQ